MTRVGLLYEPTLFNHKPPPNATHPERPERITSIYEHLCSNSLIERCISIRGRPATMEELWLAHSKRYTDKLLRALEKHPESINKGDMYANNDTLACTLLACGSACELVEQVVNNTIDSGFAIVRPPGHHAGADCYAGFCFVNNVMVAAIKASQELQKKVLIVDWDIHLGDGSINIIKTNQKQNDRLRYFSIHRWDNGAFYPGGIKGQTGIEENGKILKVGFNGPQGDEYYQAIFEEKLKPWANEFAPDLIIVSCGFDAALGDPLGGCNVTPNGYAELTSILLEISPKVVFVLEGGYNLSSIAKSTAACIETLISSP